jgi:butyryl-CoA dehydrogenase
MGATATRIGKQMSKDADALCHREVSNDPEVSKGLNEIGEALKQAIAAVTETSQFIGMTAMGDLRKAVACSVPYLKLWGITAGGWQMARAALVCARKLAAGETDEFYKAKIATAKFYATHVLSQSAHLKLQITQGSRDVMTVTEEQYDLDRKSAVVA